MPSKTKPKASPILFSGPMIRALLDGTKTQTRRVCKVESLQNGMITPRAGYSPRSPESHAGYCPYGQPGDLLWVRETWGLWANDGLPQPVFYRADYPAPDDTVLPKWRPSIHMPRWASRLTLRITDVRVERVQDITLADACDEGCELPEQFLPLWDSINAKCGFGWDANPWVWALTFEVIQANVDDVLTTPRTAP